MSHRWSAFVDGSTAALLSSDDTHYLALCHARLGEWRAAALMEQPQQRWILDSSNSNSSIGAVATILQQLYAATELDPANGELWHKWAHMHRLLIDQLGDRFGSLQESVGCALQGYLKSMSLDPQLQDVLGFLSLWFSHGSSSSSTTRTTTTPAATGNNHTAANGNHNHSNNNNNNSVDVALQGIAQVQPNVWLRVLPQVIARIHTSNPNLNEQVFQLLSIVAKYHPQALVYSLNVSSGVGGAASSTPPALSGTTTTTTNHTAASQQQQQPTPPPFHASVTTNPVFGSDPPVVASTMTTVTDRHLASQRVLHRIAELHADGAQLVKEATMVCHELVRCAVLPMEQWREEIQHAFQAYNMAGGANGGGDSAEQCWRVLEPLWAQLDLKDGAQRTKAEEHFVSEYGDALRGACAFVRDAASMPQRAEQDMKDAHNKFSDILNRFDRELSSVNSLALQIISTWLYHSGRDLLVAVPGTYREGGAFPRIASVETTLKVMNSKQRPRRLSILGSDGALYKFLLKGHEDLRLDERVMQLLMLVNTVLENHPTTKTHDCYVQAYSVTPLSDNAGLVGWVDHCDTLQDMIRAYRLNSANMMTEMELLLERSNKNPEVYRRLPIVQKLESFEQTLEGTTGEDLSRMLWLRAPSAEAWLDRRMTYVRTLGTMSIVGHVLGLGDRHPSNIMLHGFSGRVIHIDFGDCLEVTLHRKELPEKVPFRLTRMLVRAMEFAGIDGGYRHGCEAVMSVLREEKNSVLALLEAFVHDPLVTWWGEEEEEEGEGQRGGDNDNDDDESGEMLGNRSLNPQKATGSDATGATQHDAAEGNGPPLPSRGLLRSNAMGTLGPGGGGGDGGASFVLTATGGRNQPYQFGTAVGSLYSTIADKSHRRKPQQLHRNNNVDNANQQHNETNNKQARKARAVVDRIKEKLDGREFAVDAIRRRRARLLSFGGGGGGGNSEPAPGDVVEGDNNNNNDDDDDVGPLTVPRQVARLVEEATSNENLCQHYVGWCPFW